MVIFEYFLVNLLDVSYQPFSEAVLSSLPEEGDKWVVSNHHFEGRADFRDLNICSIDPVMFLLVCSKNFSPVVQILMVFN